MASTRPGAAAPASSRKIWMDGQLVPWADASVHLLSHSLQRGSLVFDYLSVHETPRGAAAFRLDLHVERFLESCRLSALPIEEDAGQVFEAVLETLRANPGATAAKICAFLPSIEVDVVPLDARVSLAVAAYDPVEDVVKTKPRELWGARRPTLKLWIEKERSQRRPDIIPAQAKVAANYESPMVAKWKARKQGYDEIVLVDSDGFLAEGPTTNVFLVESDGTVCTPPLANVLPGITRRSILELAKHDGIPVREQPLRPDALFDAAEVFLTGTSAGVWPVESVDGRAVGEATPGPVSARLREHFERVVSGRDPDFAHWLTPAQPTDPTDPTDSAGGGGE
ncbi:MAG: aminotransferase class IV [Myxococcota bacterium]